MKLSELRNLDPARIGSWPLVVRAVIVMLGCAAILGAGYWFDTRNQIAQLERVQKQEESLKTELVEKQKRAANLEPLKQQLAEIQQAFGEMLRLLPNKTEIEALLVDISQAGLASGLEFELFKPGAEQLADDFYAIQPIEIQVTGSYHEFGNFVSAVAALPRVVTQHDIAIQPRRTQQAEGEGDNPLQMNMVAKTYRYLDEEEIAAIEAEKAAKQKGRKKN